MPQTPNTSRPATNWTGIWTLAIGVFAMVTVEELPIGILTWVAEDLNTTPGTVGHTVTVAAALAAISSLAAPMAMRGIDRKHILIAALTLSALASTASAFSPNIHTLIATRTLVGIAIGTFWTVAPLVALRLATPQDSGKAMAIVFGGAGVATILGVPLGAIIANTLHWRGAFIALAATSLLIAAATHLAITGTKPVTNHLTARTYLTVTKHPIVITGITMTFLLAIAHYTALTYASPILQDHAGLPKHLVGPYLLIAGLAGLAGNTTSGIMMRKHPHATIIAIPLSLATALALIIPVAHGPLGAAIVMTLWGFTGSTLASGIQGWINRAPNHMLEPATGMFSASFNIAIGFGATIGGTVIDTYGLTYLTPTAAIVAATALGAVAWYWPKRHTATTHLNADPDVCTDSAESTDTNQSDNINPKPPHQ